MEIAYKRHYFRYIDPHLRQQRAMQQFGMMQPHAWRPQRGLPKTSVSVLRAWLFKHFLHPYPNDSEKLMLARQTGLTKGQYVVKRKAIGIWRCRDCGKVKAGGAYTLNTASAVTVRNTIHRLREQIKS